MAATLAGGKKGRCAACGRAVHLVKVAGQLTYVDPEVIAFVESGPRGETVDVETRITGRRVHAEMCDTYRIEDEKAAIKRQLVAYNKRNGRGL